MSGAAAGSAVIAYAAAFFAIGVIALAWHHFVPAFIAFTLAAASIGVGVTLIREDRP